MTLPANSQGGCWSAAQNETPALAAPFEPAKQGVFLRREDYYTKPQVATKNREKTAFLLGKSRIVDCRTPTTVRAMARDARACIRRHATRDHIDAGSRPVREFRL
jgi:hypothetical protein